VCWKSCWRRASLLYLLLSGAGAIHAQQQITPETLQRILDRLDTLEKQNEALIDEVKQLRQAIKSAQADAAAQTERLQEQASVQSEEIKTEAQTKIATSQRFSMALTGMFLFDSFLFTQGNSSTYIPDNYNPYAFGNSPAGATLRQSIIGFDFGGPQLPGGGQVHGSLSLDFWAQNGTNDIFRIRRGVLSFDWKNRSVIVGQDKSLMAPLQPTSFVWVGIPPLSGAGNLWLWRPQVRYVNAFRFRRTRGRCCKRPCSKPTKAIPHRTFLPVQRSTRGGRRWRPGSRSSINGPMTRAWRSGSAVTRAKATFWANRLRQRC
jgi:outer membrane murein-binding lipoprotein Lpp